MDCLDIYICSKYRKGKRGRRRPSSFRHHGRVARDKKRWPFRTFSQVPWYSLWDRR